VKLISKLFNLYRTFFLTFNGMALNSLHCAEVPLRNCSLTFNLHACPQWQTDGRTDGAGLTDGRQVIAMPRFALKYA